MSQTSYVQNSAAAVAGLQGGYGAGNVISLSNRTFAKNVWSYTVASDDETTTVVTLPDANATQITVTTAAQGTADATAAQHALDLASSALASWMTVEVSAATITLTGARAGWEFEVSGTNIGTPSEDTLADSSVAIPFGAGVGYAGQDGCKVVSTVATKGQVEVKVEVNTSATTYIVTINGEPSIYQPGSSPTFISVRDGLIYAINSNFALRDQVQAYVKADDALYVGALNDGGSIDVEVTEYLSTVTTNATGIAGDVAVGVALRNQLVENDNRTNPSATNEYSADGRIDVSVLIEGAVWMTAKGACSAGETARVSVASGYEGYATAETSDSVPFAGASYFETDAADGELVRVRLK